MKANPGWFATGNRRDSGRPGSGTFFIRCRVILLHQGFGGQRERWFRMGGINSVVNAAIKGRDGPAWAG